MGKPSKKPKRTPLPRPENPYKIVVMGEGGVGKSALSTRFVHGQFKDLWDPTIEDSFIKNIAIKPNDDDLAEVHQVEIIDTAGQVIRTGDYCFKTKCMLTLFIVHRKSTGLSVNSITGRGRLSYSSFQSSPWHPLST